MLKIDLQFFGGRGSSSSGSTGGIAKGELKLPDGSEIEFEGELKFGKDDPNVTGKQRQAIEDWEGKRVKNKVEYAYAVDENGVPVGKEIRGTKGSVAPPQYYRDVPNGAYSHIHPRSTDGVMGGTFSGADMNNFARSKGRTYRAAAKEGTYSISKGAGFDSAGFKSYFATSDKKHQSEYHAKVKVLNADYRAGKISYNDCVKGNAKAFNTWMVKSHNDLLAGQKQYGYTYTLERRK